MTTVAGLFQNWDNAMHAIDLLSTSGFNAADISLVATEDVAKKHRDDTRGLGVPAAGLAAAGQAGGGVTGTSGSMGGNEMGVLFYAGPLLRGGSAASLGRQAGAGAQAAAGNESTPDKGKDQKFDLVASLADAGVPRDRAQAYADEIRRGHVLVAVQTDENAAQARSLLNQANASQVSGM